MPNYAFVIVDMQYDFLPGGALGVPDGDKTIQPIIDFGHGAQEYTDALVVATRDWHPADHMSFVEQGGPWPPHCVQNTHGAEIHADILRVFPDLMIFSKGKDRNAEEYSGLLARNDDGLSLLEYLRQEQVREVYVGGLALDYCVKETAFDLWGSGFPTTVLIDATRPVDYVTGFEAAAKFGHYDQGELRTGITDEELDRL